MADFTQFLQQQSENIHTLFISDLHLSSNQPALMQAFLAFLEHLLRLNQLKQLFILGDWFDAWLGDDMLKHSKTHHWLQPMIDKLQQLSQNGCQILVLHGNRDFLLTQDFCKLFFAKKITEPYYLIYHQQIIRLEHGDGLCTDDKKYQYFRQIIQSQLTKAMLLKLPLTIRQTIAKQLRQQSQMVNSKKSLSLMDVNPQMVDLVIKDVDYLIHGHTHRPAIHQYHQRKRMVLGDWRYLENEVVAEIGYLLYDNSLGLSRYQFKN